MSDSITLGIDLGTESIGWALVRQGEKTPQILDTSVVIFNSGRDDKGESLAVTRRVKRGMRRRRARFLERRDQLLRSLVLFGLMPLDVSARKELEKKNPYQLRARAAEEKVAPFELGRALFHLNQRRGFASNRKTNSKDKDSGAYKKGIEVLKATLGEQTLGQYLWSQNNVEASESTCLRFRSISNGSKTEYPFYPTRGMYEEEFDTIREVQKRHQDLSDEQWQKLRQIIFFQRPLKPVDVGVCSLYHGQEIIDRETGEITRAPNERRAPYALSSVQMFRIVQDINNIKVRDDQRQWRPLTPKEKELLWALMNTQKKVPFATIRNKLNLPEDTAINLENDRRDFLNGNETACSLSKYFGKDFYKKPLEFQDAVVNEILDCAQEDDLFHKAVSDWGLAEESVRKMVYKDEIGEEDFPSGYGRFSAEACRALVPLMLDEGLRYDEATMRLGIHHSHRGLDGNADKLPYYADILPLSVSRPKYGSDEERLSGKIANPTVHIALRQLQKLVNAVIERYGKPDRIVIETARALKLSKKEKDAANKKHKTNKETNDRIKADLESIGAWTGDKARLLLKMQLWEELGKDPNDRRCPYTLQVISKAMLLDGRADIEHILPRSRTLDDGRANLTVATVSANRMKKNKSPYEAFSVEKPFGWNGGEGDYSYDKILQQAKNFPKNKQWRFEADAMEKFADENEWQTRFLNDTRYASKIAKQYLETICPCVETSAGRLTAKIREEWGLNDILGHNKKNRDDHRQHAVDALVLTQITRSLVKKAAEANANEALDGFLIPSTEDIGWPTLWEDARKAIHAAVIHHRPDHGTDGPINEESAYGIIYDKDLNIDRRTNEEKRRDEEEKKVYNLAIRKDIASLSENELGLIRDPLLRRRIVEFVAENDAIPKDKKKLSAKLLAFKNKTGVRRVRIRSMNNPIKIIRHGNAQQHLKGLVPGKNHHVSVWRMPDGQIKVIGVSMFDAKVNEKNPNAFKPHPAAKLLMKLHKKDVVRLLHKGEEKTAKIISLRPGPKQIVLVEHYEAGNPDERQKEEKIQIFLSFSKILEQKVRKIHVDPTGKVYDPGPHVLPEGKTS